MVNKMEVYAICLDNETARKSFLQSNLSALDLVPKYVGIDGKYITLEQRNIYSEGDAKRRWGRVLTDGEIGVYLSHLAVWKDIIGRNIDFALIIESDAVVTKTTINIVQALLLKGIRIDMVMLSWLDCVPSFWGRKTLVPGYDLVRFSRKSHGAAGYLLSMHGAKELVKYSDKITMPVDELMCGGQIKKDMEIYAIYPQAIGLIKDSDGSSVLKHERDSVRGRIAPGVKPRKVGLKRFEQFVRHFMLQLKMPPEV